jgi:hypothetical protein
LTVGFTANRFSAYRQTTFIVASVTTSMISAILSPRPASTLACTVAAGIVRPRQVARRARVGHDDDPVAAVKGFAGGRINAVVGNVAGDDQRFDAAPLQFIEQAGAGESRGKMFVDDGFALARRQAGDGRGAFGFRGEEWCFRRVGEEKEETRVRVTSNVVVNNSEVVRDLVLAGMGIGLVWNYAVDREIADGRLLPLLPEWSPIGPFGQTAYALWLPQTHLPPKIRIFVDFLAERLRETPAADLS